MPLPPSLRRTLLIAVLLPVAAVAQGVASAAPPFPMAARDIPRGVVLTAADMVVPDGAEHTVGAGWITRRLVRAGEPLRPPAVAPPQLVARGETVEVRSAAGAARITVRGTALSAGALGDRILVRVGSGWTLEGIVDGQGTLTLHGARGSI